MLGRKSLTLFASQWFINGVQLATSVWMARTLGPAAMGIMAFCFGLIGLFMMITSLGFSQAHIKRVADGLPLGECVATFGAICLSLNAAACLILLATWPILSRVLVQPGSKMVFVCLFAYQVLINLSLILVQTFTGRQEMAKVALCTGASNAIRFIAVGTALLIKASLPTVCLAYLCEPIAQIVIALWLSPNLGGSLLLSRKTLHSYWAYAKPLFIISPISTLIDSIDRVILGAYFTPTQLGFYSIARNMFEAFKSLPSAIITVLAPRLSSEFSLTDHTRLRETFRQVLRKMMLIMTPLTVISIMLAPLGIELLYGRTYLPAAGCASAFLVVTWLMALFSPFQYLLLATERHGLLLKLNPIIMAVYVAALWAVGRWSGNLAGAALAQSVFWLVPAIPVFWTVRDLVGRGFLAQTLRIAFAGLIMLLFLIPIPLLHWSRWWALPFALPAIAIYMALVVLMKEGSRHDLLAFWDNLHLGKMWHYIRTETSGQ